MKLIVGLGNPGIKYTNTRHNAGFIFIDKLLEHFKYDKKDAKFDGEVYKSIINGEKIIFLKPMKFMNLSGECVRQVVDFYKIEISNILIIYDDKDFELGIVKWRNKGSSGGHNGIKNICTNLRTLEFSRLRVGIGMPPNKDYLIVDWVLSNFNDSELKILEKTFQKSINGIEKFINNVSFENIMNENN
ncbi:aminoacyl-tRNA hydrolase [Spiroplasma endosymbiont of Aspidapion aeneum]|uniref:aminoacyl-tRNA hydrolase n=1 Tax=Spiroplasma endosymbiont of Aspidapion aeneum TaxID=3066276 RepID=UPI00313CC8AB